MVNHTIFPRLADHRLESRMVLLDKRRWYLFCSYPPGGGLYAGKTTNFRGDREIGQVIRNRQARRVHQ